MALSFRTEHYLFYRTNEIKLRHLNPFLAGRKDRRFVHKRVEIGAGKTGRTFGD